MPSLYAHRLERSLTQQELAYHAGVSLVTISRLERGYAARPQTIRKLAKALKCTTDALRADPDNG